MKVKEMIKILQEQPQEAEVLIDCRETDSIKIYSHNDWYYDDKDEVVVHINTLKFRRKL